MERHKTGLGKSMQSRYGVCWDWTTMDKISYSLELKIPWIYLLIGCFFCFHQEFLCSFFICLAIMLSTETKLPKLCFLLMKCQMATITV